MYHTPGKHKGFFILFLISSFWSPVKDCQSLSTLKQESRNHYHLKRKPSWRSLKQRNPHYEWIYQLHQRRDIMSTRSKYMQVTLTISTMLTIPPGCDIVWTQHQKLYKTTFLNVSNGTYFPTPLKNWLVFLIPKHYQVTCWLLNVGKIHWRLCKTPFTFVWLMGLQIVLFVPYNFIWETYNQNFKDMYTTQHVTRPYWYILFITHFKDGRAIKQDWLLCWMHNIPLIQLERLYTWGNCM